MECLVQMGFGSACHPSCHWEIVCEAHIGSCLGRELKGTIHCSCHHSVPGFGPNQLLETLFQDSVPLHHDSSWAPCRPPLPSASACASSSLFSCPPKSTFWALAMQGSSRDPQRTRHFVCLRLSFLLPSFWTLGIFHEAKVKIKWQHPSCL